MIRFMPAYRVRNYLGKFGYKISTATEDWELFPAKNSLDSPTLRIELVEHVKKQGHTWYMLKCALSKLDLDGYRTWSAPRHLLQLREDLHDHVKNLLGDNGYVEIFSATP